MKQAVFLSTVALLLCFAHAADIVNETCKSCAAGDPELNYQLCLSIFNSVPSSHQADLEGLALIAIDVTTKKAKQVLGDIDNLSKHGPIDRATKQCLDTCKESYADAVDGLKESAVSIKSGHIDDARTLLSAAFDAGSTCEQGFEELKIKSPLSKDNDEYTSVGRISLAVAALLDN
ncbi:hypothetical protein HPP92_007202 [Vanilla planifolia]|uniref:Pectinesterase inhibitor domain-containing protein n=1 Tax=Vanilla planifolia TaxID=51239 RepID=A0A835RFS2_VANPL|nr:hypothetical protein HPP92_007202 [Vanilla planifolia]